MARRTGQEKQAVVPASHRSHAKIMLCRSAASSCHPNTALWNWCRTRRVESERPPEPTSGFLPRPCPPRIDRQPLAFGSRLLCDCTLLVRFLLVFDVTRAGRLPSLVRARVESEGSVDDRHRQELVLGAAHEIVSSRALRSLHPPASEKATSVTKNYAPLKGVRPNLLAADKHRDNFS